MRPHLVPMPISIKNAKDRNNIETSSEDKIEINENKYLCRNKQYSLKLQNKICGKLSERKFVDYLIKLKVNVKLA